MLRKLSLFTIILLTFSAVFAQEETEPAGISKITKFKLPTGAARVLPGSVPAEINNSLEQIIESGKGKIVGGEREVLAWTGADYKKTGASNLVRQIENNLKAQGWEYEVGAEEDGVIFFSALRENPSKRAILGFFASDKKALVLAWTEVLAADAASQNLPEEKIESAPVSRNRNDSVKNDSTLNNLTGKWERKTSGMSSYSNGIYKGSSGNYESYTIYADGRVEYTSLIAVQNYNCRLEAFSQRKGRVTISGTRLTMNLADGTVKRDDSCSPSKNYTNRLEATNFSYDWKIEKDEYGNIQLALTEADGNVYYYRRVNQ